MRMKNQYLFILVMLICSTVFQSCKSDPQSPGVEYMPDMYRTDAIETYQEDSLRNGGFSALKPVKNSIPRGFDVYPYDNTAEGYESAGAELRNPIPCTPVVIEEAQLLYSKFCVHCHGGAGEGDGMVVKSKNWPGPPPAYNSAQLKDLPEGKIFHSIHYGKGMMGSHASQISKEDRWKLVHYVQKLQGKEKPCDGTKSNDSDGDGVEDNIDQCPETPGSPDYFGCPEVEAEVAQVMEEAIKGVNFATGSSKIKKSSYDVLVKVKEVLLKYPNYVLLVNGHTDNKGDFDKNMELSKSRANAVMDYLTSHGINSDHVSAHGYGSTKPLASNDSKDGRAKNRRVEFRIVY